MDMNKINLENNCKVISASNLNSLGFEVIEIKDTDLKEKLLGKIDVVASDESDQDELSLEDILNDLKESKKRDEQKKLSDSNADSSSSDRTKLVLVRKDEKKASTKKKKIIFV